MNTPYAWQTATARTSGAVFDEGLRQHMLRVYNYMGIGLVRDRPRCLLRRLDARPLRADLPDAAEVGRDAGAAGLHLLLLVPHARHVGGIRPDGCSGPSAP